MVRAVTVRICGGCKREVPYKETVRAVETITGTQVLDWTQYCSQCWQSLTRGRVERRHDVRSGAQGTLRRGLGVNR